MREGYPRAIPDRGTYWHLGKEVKRPVTGADADERAPRDQQAGAEAHEVEGRAGDQHGAQADRGEGEGAQTRKDGVPEIIDRTKRASDDD